MQTETGKTRGQAFEEVFNAANATRYNALSARRVLKGGRRRGGIPFVFVPRVHYTPKGVVGVITPWNYPLALAIMDIAPALAAGNGVVQKADNQGAISILTARRAFIDAGLPAALWAVVDGRGRRHRQRGRRRRRLRRASPARPRPVASVAERAAARLVGASMELGGKNAVIVLDDVDPVKAAADVANACFTASGQLCVSMERVYVMKGVADAFIPAFAERVKSMVIGPAFDYSTDFGSLATRAAARERDGAHRRRQEEGRDRARRRQRPPRHRAVLHRADRAHRRDRRHEVRGRRDLRAGRRRPRRRLRGRGRARPRTTRSTASTRSVFSRSRGAGAGGSRSA